jgi:hypothetical protein
MTDGNLASSLSSEGKYDETEKMEREVLEVKQRVLGEEHPESLITAGNLADSLTRQGKYDEAEKMARMGDFEEMFGRRTGVWWIPRESARLRRTATCSRDSGGWETEGWLLPFGRLGSLKRRRTSFFQACCAREVNGATPRFAWGCAVGRFNSELLRLFEDSPCSRVGTRENPNSAEESQSVCQGREFSAS